MAATCTSPTPNCTSLAHCPSNFLRPQLLRHQELTKSTRRRLLDFDHPIERHKNFKNVHQSPRALMTIHRTMVLLRQRDLTALGIATFELEVLGKVRFAAENLNQHVGLVFELHDF